GPIALVEVQGYAFAAFRELSALARRRGEIDRADHWESSAEAMRAAVERHFWLDDLGFYASAIDGAGEPCK
ncbi:MAG: amylo-alpha-1,6-glucosidase, partial [Mesorhizobium sp.]